MEYEIVNFKWAVLTFLGYVFIGGVVGTAANMYAFRRLRVFHAKVFFDLGAPTQDKMHSLSGATRRKWKAFLRSKEYLTLNDPHLRRACITSLWVDRLALIMVLAVIVLIGYPFIQGRFY